MSFAAILRSDLIKYKRTVLWKGIFLTPILSFILLFADLHLRYEYLISSIQMKKASEVGIFTKMDVLFYQNHMAVLWFMLFNLAVVAVSFIINYTEYSENTWKQMLSRPVGRGKIYLSKWLITFAAALILITLNGIALIIVKKIFNIEGNSLLILRYMWFEIAGAVGVVSFQQFISCYFKNSLGAAAVGFAGAVGAHLFAQSKVLGNLVPYACFLRVLPLEDMSDAITAGVSGLALGILWLLIGVYEFNKRDIQ
ncbi:ABC transporter permease [Clostridium thailandense]|uniref:ABC transporter permease n=1 Tax=Clostridium thailandense TaxID=2794346 RepID=UPI00398A13C8